MNGIVCAPGYTAEQWRIAGPMVERWLPDTSGRHAAAYTAMLVTRIGAVLRDPRAADGLPYDQWVQEFLDRARAMISVKDLPRELRGLMIDWIPWPHPRSVPSPGDPAAQARLADLLTASIDVITQFSGRTARYPLLLMDRIRETSLPDGMADDLRYRLVRGILRSQDAYDARWARTGAAGRLNIENNTRKTNSALSRLLLDAAGRRCRTRTPRWATRSRPSGTT